MSTHIQFLGADENYVFAAFKDEENTQVGAEVHIFDIKAWFEKDAQLTKHPIKSFNVVNTLTKTDGNEDVDYLMFNEGIAAGFATPANTEYKLPTIGFHYDPERADGFTISFIQTSEDQTNKTKPQFVLKDLSFVQAYVSEEVLVKQEQTSFNLQEELIKAFKKDMRFKDAKLLATLGDELFEVQTALSHNEAKFIVSLIHPKLSILLAINQKDLTIKTFTSSQINALIPNCKMSTELPFFVETTDEEVIFLEPTPFEFDIDRSKYNYLCYYYKFGDSKKRVRPDLSALFIDAQYDHAQYYPFRLLSICNNYGIDIIAHDFIRADEKAEHEIFSSAYVMALQGSTELSSKPIINKVLFFARERQFVLEENEGRIHCKPFKSK